MTETTGVSVDLSYLIEFSNGDITVIAELIDVFFQSFSNGLEKLKSNITDGENIDWSETGHKLKGASGYVGAAKMRALCAQAQNMKVASKEDRANLFQQIQAEYDTICELLKDYISDTGKQ